MGIVEGQGVHNTSLGCECAGIVHAVGREVTHVKIGDRVMVTSPGSFSTMLTTIGKICARIPDQLNFEDAATMPCVYSTVIHALLDLGGLKRDQVVLHAMSPREIS
jgi:NADPH:quinone reductase-like Zn-dependent oxidoreductase